MWMGWNAYIKASGVLEFTTKYTFTDVFFEKSSISTSDGRQIETLELHYSRYTVGRPMAPPK